MAQNSRHGGLQVFEPLDRIGDLGFLHHRWNGKRYPPFINPAVTRRLLDSWDTEGNDVFICTHQKVGTHLTKKYVVEILRAATDYPPGNPMSTGDIGHHTVAWPEVMASQQGFGQFRDHLDRTAGHPRAWYIHCCAEDLPVRSVHPGTKFILVLRDPKGAAVSQFFFYRAHPLLGVSPELDMGTFVDLFLEGDLYFGDYHRHALGWLNPEGSKIPAANLLLLRYEDLVERKTETASLLADFLVPSHRLTAAQLDEIAQSTEFETMKKNIAENPGSFHFNPKTFFRSGTTRDWEQHLPPWAVAAIDEKTRKIWGGDDLSCPPTGNVLSLKR